ncbi:MAG: AraC family transcriptional regulator [Treponema sp.]|nr:AraC family transcriptional regulator [Treponema sp.]
MAVNAEEFNSQVRYPYHPEWIADTDPSPVGHDRYDDRYKILSGDFDLTGAIMKRGREFIPSPMARRSYFYLQLISTSQFPKNHYTIRRGVNSYLLASTFSGKGELQYEGKSYTLEPGESFLIDCRKPHQYRAASREGWGYHIIHFDGFAMRDYFSRIEQGKSVKFAFSPESPFPSLLEKLFGVNAEQSGRNEMLSSCLLTNMLTEIMLTLPDYDSEEIPRKIREVRDYIQENFAGSVHLEELSGRFYISKYYLCHEFKKYTGLSPNEYLITVRLNKARGLLQFSDLRICEIGELTGFASLNHFFYTFKKHEGISPSEYRKRWKNTNRLID